MKMTITKRQVLKALDTEPLMGGKWTHPELRNPKMFKNNIHCPVCAVGAIIDSSLKSSSRYRVQLISKKIVSDCYWESCYDVDTKHGLKNLIKETEKVAIECKKPLSALSILFENITEHEKFVTKSGLANYKARRLLKSFVKKNFPNKIVIDLNKDATL